MWHPEQDLSISYACNMMEADPGNEISRQLQLTVLSCADDIDAAAEAARNKKKE